MVNTMACSSMRVFGAMASLFIGGTLNHSEEFNQSDDDFKTPEVFPISCVV